MTTIERTQKRLRRWSTSSTHDAGAHYISGASMVVENTLRIATL